MFNIMDILNGITTPSYFTVNKDDSELFNLLHITDYNGYICGGAALCWYNNMSCKHHDIDIWVSNIENFVKLRDNILTKFTICKTYETEFAYTLDINFKGNDQRIQLIKDYTSDIHSVISKFDISICQVATDGNKWYVSDHFIQDNKNKKIRVLNYHENIIKRILKYYNYGYHFDDSILMNLINDSNLKWDFDFTTEEDYNNAL